MLDAPAVEQIPGRVGSEFGSDVSCQSGRDPEGRKRVSGQSCGAVGGWGDNRPARVPVNQHQICCSFVVEEVSTDVLEGVLWLFGSCRWHRSLRGSMQ